MFKFKVTGMGECYFECIVEATDEEAARDEAYFNGNWVQTDRGEVIHVEEVYPLDT